MQELFELLLHVTCSVIVPHVTLFYYYMCYYVLDSISAYSEISQNVDQLLQDMLIHIWCILEPVCFVHIRNL